MKNCFYLLLSLHANLLFAQKIKQVSIIEKDEFNKAKSAYKIDFRKINNLKYHQNTLLIEFDNPDSLISQLTPVDSNSYFNYCKSVFYSQLQGGDYTFQLINPKTKQVLDSYKFSIEQPFYKKWWFYVAILAYIIFMIGIIFYLFFNYRFRQQTKLQRVRDNIASDLHDDVGATLSSISFFGEMMRSKIIKNAPKEEVLPLLDKLISTSKETIETMRGVVWTINPNNDNAVDFFQKLQTFGKEMLSAKNMAYDLSIEGFENLKLPLEVQRNFFLFYKETINNIAKHSKATSVEAFIKPQKEGIEFSIKDNGVGFNPAEIYEGHGLKSLRKRAEELEGSFDIQSTEGKGTTINLYFPLP